MRSNYSIIAGALAICVAGCFNTRNTSNSPPHQRVIKEPSASAVAISVSQDRLTPAPSGISIATTSSLDRQDSSIFAPLTEQNILDALKLMGVYSYNIKIPLADFGAYHFYVHLDEYAKDSLIRKSETRLAILEKAVNPTGQENYMVSLTVLDKNADEFVVNWKLPSGTQQKLTKKKDKKNSIDFNVIKFTTNNIVPEKKIPILLCGSSWYDSTYKAYRFCMERELNPDFSNAAFKQIPAYYVLSVELSKE